MMSQFKGYNIMLSVRNNISAMSGIAQFNQISRSQAKLQKAMASGKRINSASDDAAGSAIANKMSARIGSMKMAQRNVGDAQSVIGVADGALKGIADNLGKLRELAVQAKSDTLSADERANVKTQMDAIVSDISDFAGEAEFNGIALLDGTADLSIQAGADKGDTMSITIGTAFDAAGLSVDALTVDSAANAGTSMDAIDAAIKSVNTQQASLGALSNRFTSRTDFLSTTIENQSAALSQIEDLDYAEASAESMKLDIRSQSATFALSKSISAPQSILSLLG
jgi:flagellin